MIAPRALQVSIVRPVRSLCAFVQLIAQRTHPRTPIQLVRRPSSALRATSRKACLCSPVVSLRRTLTPDHPPQPLLPHNTELFRLSSCRRLSCTHFISTCRVSQSVVQTNHSSRSISLTILKKRPSCTIPPSPTTSTSSYWSGRRPADHSLPYILTQLLRGK